MSERERFEQWGNAKGTMGDSWSGDHYRNSLHEAAWQAWQAAIQAERERCAKMVADAFSGVGGQAVANKILNICDNSNPTYKTRIEQVKSIVTNWREAIADAIRRGGEHEHNE